MCSIVGVLWLGRDLPPEDALRARVDAGLDVLRNRGPDERAVTAVTPYCLLGANRLIIRGAPGIGTMPFRDGARLATYNGEIYNYRDWTPTAASDGEALLPAYAAAGPACFRAFDGEFAVALWDDRNETLILARDPFGTKPLYFSLNGDRLLWASTAGAIQAMEPHPLCRPVTGPNVDATFTPQEPYTSYRGIWQVPPAHVLLASRQGIALRAYHTWPDAPADSDDPTEAFAALEESLRRRLDYGGTIGIPLSGGIDSGIIAFMADRLGVPYHVFSVIEMLGRPTAEAATIQARIERLRRPAGVTLLSCNEPDVEAALHEVFAPDYYDSVAFDTSNVPVHTVYQAMHRAGIRVALDGTGGDELFYGYEHRHEFGPVPDWPRPWREPYRYALFTTLPAFTAKADRAGGHFAIESRFPFQSLRLFNASLRLRPGPISKWPLRRFLLERLDYGPPLPYDERGKVGFSMPHADRPRISAELERAWLKAHGLTQPPTEAPLRFPFTIGEPLPAGLTI